MSAVLGDSTHVIRNCCSFTVERDTVACRWSEMDLDVSYEIVLLI